MNDETDCRTAPATLGLLNTPEIHLRIIWVRVQIEWPRATLFSGVKVMGLGVSRLNPGRVHSVSRLDKGVTCGVSW